MTGELFLTGATGFIGSSLLQKWLNSSDVKFNLLARSRREESPEDRIKRVLAELYPNTDVSRFSERIEVIKGDISLDKFGLKDPEYERLANKTSHIIHCAAAVRFDLELQDARKTNVRGIENILNFARKCERLEKIDYIGTAYVAGRRKGIIKEDELNKGQQHNNTYEITKFEAEKLIRESMDEFPISILRPSIVICDSKTGRASSFSAFYRVLRMYMLGWLKMLPGYPSCLMDLVPVDYIADATYAISKNMASIGKCYHLTARLNNMTTLEEIRNLASYHFGKEKFTLIPPEEFNVYVSKIANKLSEKERDMIDEIRIYIPYLTSKLKFDNSNTLRATGLEIPKVSSYFGRAAEYIMKYTER